MKILLVGVFTYGSTDVWKKLALERLGHRVVCCSYRERSVEEHFATGEPFDVVFVSKGVPLTAAQFAHLATLGKHRLLWWPDPFENWNEHLTAALRTGDWCVSATSEVVLQKILGQQFDPHAPQAMTCLPFRWARILEGCDCEGPRPAWAPTRVEPSLLHFGSLTPRRGEVIDRVRSAGVPVRVVEQPVFGAALQRLVLAHAAVLGINTSPDLYSNRVQTVLAMGGVMLQEDAPELRDDLSPHFRGLIWTDETLVRMARIVTGPFITVGDPHATFQRLRWERVMERALTFATNGAA